MDPFCLDLLVCERHHSVFHDDKWWIVYCFADAEHAEKFRVRFGGERCGLRARQFMRANWLSNRVFKSFDDIVDHCCYAWNTLIDQPWKIMSIARRDWALAGHSL